MYWPHRGKGLIRSYFPHETANLPNGSKHRLLWSMNIVFLECWFVSWLGIEYWSTCLWAKGANLKYWMKYIILVFKKSISNKICIEFCIYQTVLRQGVIHVVRVASIPLQISCNSFKSTAISVIHFGDLLSKWQISKAIRNHAIKGKLFLGDMNWRKMGKSSNILESCSNFDRTKSVLKL